MKIIDLPSHAEWNDKIKYVYLSVDTKLAYMEVGNPEKEPLVLLHGFSDSSRGWRMIMQDLINDYHIFAIDLRGHGMSDAPDVPIFPMLSQAEDIHSFIDIKGIAPTYVAGHSMGSYVAHTLAAIYPSDVKKLCLAATMAHMHEDKEGFETAKKIMENFAENCRSDEYMEEWLGESKKFKDPEYFEYYKKNVRNMEAHVFTAAWYSMSTADHRNIMRYIEIPTMVAWGSGDELFTEEYQNEVRSIIPTIERFVTYEGCSHEILQECPKELADDMKLFFS